MGQKVTCVSVGTDPEALTRGQGYEVVALDEEKGRVRIHGDDGRTGWFPLDWFDLEGRPTPTLVRWWFADAVQDETRDLVDVSFELSDGTLRWCWMGTPDYLKWLLEERSDPAQWAAAWEPAVWGPHLIVVRRLTQEEVDWVLRHIDQQGELAAISLPFEETGIDGDDDTD